MNSRPNTFLLHPSAFILAVLAIGLVPATRAAELDAAQAQEILKTAGLARGLCVHLGCGRQECPGLTAELAAGSSMLVHGLALDDASLDRARKAIVERNVLGQASVERLPLNPLPYVRDLANLVVIEDFQLLAAQGLTRAEVERITAPGGVICVKVHGQDARATDGSGTAFQAVKEGSRWTPAIKARPKEMDEWTHPNRGADGNRVSADRLVALPLGLRWQDGLPVNFNIYTSSRGYVFAGGRCFTLGPNVFENLAKAAYLTPNVEEHLVARDAFNGLPLWDVNCETRNVTNMVSAYNLAPLATDGRRVYVYKKDRLVALDAESGKVAVEYPVKYPAERLLLLGGVLVSSEWESKENAKEGGHGLAYAYHSVAKTTLGAVEAFDAQDGKLKWSVPAPAQEILGGDGLVFMLFQSGNPATQAEIRAVDLQTGRERWRTTPASLRQDPAIHLNCACCGVLVVGQIKAKVVTIYSAADGKKLWEINPAARPEAFGILWTPMVDGLLWRSGKKFDPLTGEVKGKLPSESYEATPCSPLLIVNNLVCNAHNGNFWDLSRNGRYLTCDFSKAACNEGTVVANGMFYTAQNHCACFPGQVPGFVAYGPCGKVPEQADFEKVRTVEKGPAFGAAGEATPPTPPSPPGGEGRARGDWPLYRHDPQRSGATNESLPPRLKVLWQAEAAPLSKGPLSAAWQARLMPSLSAPVVAEGKVFVAATDLGQVLALDAATGQTAWRAMIGARVDSPPAIHRGLCIFGAHDGWVSALSVRDGTLAWRTPVAPWERRMVAFGQVESLWPAIGAVLIQDNAVYASAGRSSEADGGVALCSFDAATGAQRWAARIGTGTRSQNDVMTASDGKINWRHVKIVPESGALEGAGKDGRGGTGVSPVVMGKMPMLRGGIQGLHDGTWTRLDKRRSGNRVFGRVTAETFVWNDTMLFGYESFVNWNNKNRWCFALPRSKTEGAEKLKPEEYAWRLIMPPDSQVEAMALCANGLLAAGRAWDPKSDQQRGFLWVVSLADGKKQAEYALDSPPVYDGVAVANGRVYVSLQSGRIVCFDKAE